MIFLNVFSEPLILDLENHESIPSLPGIGIKFCKPRKSVKQNSGHIENGRYRSSSSVINLNLNDCLKTKLIVSNSFAIARNCGTTLSPFLS